jgi:hypothetical protein
MRKSITCVLAGALSVTLALSIATMTTASAANSSNFCSDLSADGGASAFAQAATSSGDVTALATSAQQLAKEAPSKSLASSLTTMAKFLNKLSQDPKAGGAATKDAANLSKASAKLSSYAAAKCASASPSASATGLSGSWSGTYTGGGNGTFSLDWQQSGSNLTGTIVLDGDSEDPIPINGTVNGSTINFGTVGGPNGVTYTGKMSGSSMSGTWKAPVGSGNWTATKSS